MNKRLLLKLYTGFIAFCLIILIVTPSFSKEPVKIAEAAGPALDVLGYAWSYHPHEQENEPLPNVSGVSTIQTGTQGFGWISMSGINPSSGGGNYQVQIDPITGKFSGYAWSENGGWVNFAPTGPYPSAAGTTAQSAFVDPACLADKTRTCDVKGWVRFIGAATGGSSWDGWVNMEIFNDATVADVYNFPISAPAKGVKLLPESVGFRNMSGYAWGDDLVGIIGFSKAKVKLADVCPDTNFVMTSDPKNTGVDPKTAGTQTTMPVGYTLSTDKTMCGIFGCTDKTATNYVKTATVDDGSCKFIPKVDLCPETKFTAISDTAICGSIGRPATRLQCKNTSGGPNGNGIINGVQYYNYNGDINIATVGIQTVIPPDYEVRDIDGVKYCAIFGCTDVNAVNFDKGALFDDGSCTTYISCPDGSEAPNGDLSQCSKPPLCSDGTPVPPGGCPGGNPEDQCKNIEGDQLTVDSPYTQVIQAGIKNCYIIGCTDPYAKNYNASATMSANPNICTYDPGVETCKVRGDCPNYPTAPKKPIYIET